MKKKLFLLPLFLLVSCSNQELPSNDAYYCTAPKENPETIQYMGFKGHIKEVKGKKYFVNSSSRYQFFGYIPEDVKLQKEEWKMVGNEETNYLADTTWEKEDTTKEVFATFKTTIDSNYQGKYICPSRYKMEEVVDTLYFDVTLYNVFSQSGLKIFQDTF